MGCLDWYLYADLDWEKVNERLRNYAPIISGLLFGAGWWAWVDAIVYSQSIKGESFPFVYWIPGIVASLALICMNLVSRDDLESINDVYSGDEEAGTRARCWLFVSYIIAFSSVAGSAAVLITCTKHQDHVWVGVASLLQCGLILLSGLLLWAFRTPSDDTMLTY